MCKAPKAPTPKEPKKPMFLRNRYLDEFVGESAAVKSLKTGRGTLRIPLSGPAPVGGRQPGDSLVTPTSTPPTGGNANTPPLNGDFRFVPGIRGRGRLIP